MSNRELDRWIAENVMGWNIRETDYDYGQLHSHGTSIYYWCEGIEKRVREGCWQPTESISDAFQVVEKMNDCLHLSEHGKDGIWAAMFCTYGHEWVSGETAPLAICLAAKKAIEGVE